MDCTYTVSELFKEIKYRGQKNYRLNNIFTSYTYKTSFCRRKDIPQTK